MGSRNKKNKKGKKKRGHPRKPGLIPPHLDGDAVVIFTPPGHEKMSAVILEFIKPYQGQWRTVDEFGELVGMAAIAWNTALIPEDRRDQSLQNVIQKLPADGRHEAGIFLAELMRRKLTLFASNHRAIHDYKVTMTPVGPHLTVVSSLDKPLTESEKKNLHNI
jgi:hypothetical protein